LALARPGDYSEALLIRTLDLVRPTLVSGQQATHPHSEHLQLQQLPQHLPLVQQLVECHYSDRAERQPLLQLLGLQTPLPSLVACLALPRLQLSVCKGALAVSLSNSFHLAGSLFGGGGTTGTSLFGATSTAAPATSTAPAFSFGNAGTTGGGLFGAKPAGTTTNTTGGFGFGNSTLNKPATGTTGLGGGSLFGGGAQTQASTLGGGFGGFGSSTAIATGPSLQASVDQNPYGNNPLFNSVSSASQGPKATSILAPKTPATEKIKAVSTPHYKLNPRSASKIKLRGFASPSAIMPGQKTPGRQSLHLFDGVNNDKILSPEVFVPRQSAKKLVIRPDNDDETQEFSTILTPGGVNISTPSRPTPSASGLTGSVRKVTFNTMAESTPMNGNLLDRIKATSTPESSKPKGLTVQSLAESTPSNDTQDGYSMSPSSHLLSKMNGRELSSVRNFTVSRPNFGTLRYLEPVNLSAIDVKDICGTLVVLEHKCCVVYPDESIKPAVGDGLNFPAEISLLRCWPIDKATQEPIKDPNHKRMGIFIEKLKGSPDTTFIDYKPETGEWKFRVEHFSKYGIDDSDDEEDTNAENQAPVEVSRISKPNLPPSSASKATPTRFKSLLDNMNVDRHRIASMRNALFEEKSSPSTTSLTQKFESPRKILSPRDNVEHEPIVTEKAKSLMAKLQLPESDGDDESEREEYSDGSEEEGDSYMSDNQSLSENEEENSPDYMQEEYSDDITEEGSQASSSPSEPTELLQVLQGFFSIDP
jgi:nuclear pore complex protein Nup98-Nup96